MHPTLPRLIISNFPRVTRDKLHTLQVNLGYVCNQSCLHCHVNASPKRREQMNRKTVKLVLKVLHSQTISNLDLTGGAPELNPHFRYLVSEAKQLGVHIIDRCNLTILEEPGQEDLTDFLAQHQVEVVASLPCYLQENVDSQRGKGVYDSSMAGLKRLNAAGYGKTNSPLKLNLVYNPIGASLPPSQTLLEADYKQQLDKLGITFNQLFTITNMPIKRFGSTLISKGGFDEYMHLLKSAHQTTNLPDLMCRSLVSIDWQGYLYDCDFNQMLGLSLLLPNTDRPHLKDLLEHDLHKLPITVADHCYGCTAGQGSSCGGALE
jgi:radical SAM/Cys-rich protein